MSNSSFWADNDLGRRITDILYANARRDTEHHFGPSFVTAYQLAILLKARYAAVFERFGRPLLAEGAPVTMSASHSTSRGSFHSGSEAGRSPTSRGDSSPTNMSGTSSSTTRAIRSSPHRTGPVSPCSATANPAERERAPGSTPPGGLPLLVQP